MEEEFEPAVESNDVPDSEPFWSQSQPPWVSDPHYFSRPKVPPTFTPPPEPRELRHCRINRIPRDRGSHGDRWSSLIPKKENRIQIKNETDTTICIVCTQELVSVLDNGGAGINAGASGVDIKIDVAKSLVGVKEIKCVLKLGPNESQDVMAASKYATVSVLSVQEETMKLLFKNALLKRGHRLTVEQRDVVNALGDFNLDIQGL